MYRNLVAEIFVDRLGPAGVLIFNRFKEFVKDRRLDIDPILRGQLPQIACNVVIYPLGDTVVRCFIPILGNPPDNVVSFFCYDSDYYLQKRMSEFPWSNAFLATLLGTFGIIPSPSECDRFLLNGWFNHGTRWMLSNPPTVTANQQDTTLDRYSHERMLEVACEE